MEIWQELSNFQTTSQRLADQVRSIMKKGWFSELDIMEIHQKINDQERSHSTLPGTSNINKQKQPIKNEPPTSEYGNSTQPNTTQQNNLQLTLTQEQILILRNLKIILNSETTTLPSLRNWRIVKASTCQHLKHNQVQTCISTNNITELNELIYEGARLVCEKTGIPSKITKEKSKPGLEFRLKTQIKNIRKQLKGIKQKKNAGINRKRKEKTTQEKLTIQLEEIYQKVLAKEGRLKGYQQKVKQYRQNRTFQNNERKFYQQLEDDNKTYHQPDEKETQRFWTKRWLPKNNEKAELINHIKRERELEKTRKLIYTLIYSKRHLKRYQTGKRMAMMKYMVSGSRSSPPFTTD